MAGRRLASAGIGADVVPFLGLTIGIAAALAIALGQFWIGLALFLLNRIADGLDGAVARATTRTDRGGFLDIAFDFLVYAAMPLAFAIHDAHAKWARRGLLARKLSCQRQRVFCLRHHGRAARAHNHASWTQVDLLSGRHCRRL
jgi:phosphatidylglycerophosphate synthase